MKRPALACGRESAAGWLVQGDASPRTLPPPCFAGNDADHVDCDWFLCPVKILDHEGPLITSFPVENRLVPQVRG